VASILGAMIINGLSRRVDTVKLYYYTNIILAVLGILMWFIPTGAQYRSLWLAVIFINSIILGFTLTLHFSLMAFADDYGFWKTRIRSSGMSFAFNLFFIKLSWASSAGIISLVFILVAYAPGIDHQTPASLHGIQIMETLLPVIFHLLLIVALRFCRLDNRSMARISSDLKDRQVS